MYASMPAKKARASEEAPRPAIETARGIDDNIAATGNKVQESLGFIARPPVTSAAASNDPAS